MLAQLKAAKVRLALEEQRRRRAADRKARIQAGNQQLLAKLNAKIASEEVQQALSKEADALLAKSVVDDALGVDAEATQVSAWVMYFFDSANKRSVALLCVYHASD